MAGINATGEDGAIRFVHLSDMHVEPDLQGPRLAIPSRA